MDSTEFAITFFTALTLMANAATVGLVGLALAARLTGRGRAPARAWQRLREDLTPAAALGLAALVAGVATAGSLYFSEVAGFIPCRLCWIQRGFMYPLVLVLGTAALVTSRSPAAATARWLRRLAAATAVVGGGVSVWHLLIERFPDLESATACDISNPCSLIWFERLGFVTLPYMALSGFLLIVALTAMAIFASRPASGTHFSSSPHRPRPPKHAAGTSGRTTRPAITPTDMKPRSDDLTESPDGTLAPTPADGTPPVPARSDPAPRLTEPLNPTSQLPAHPPWPLARPSGGPTRPHQASRAGPVPGSGRAAGTAPAHSLSPKGSAGEAVPKTSPPFSSPGGSGPTP